MQRKILLYALDNILSIISIYFAFLLRWDWNIPGDQLKVLLSLIPFIFISRSISFLYFGFYSRFWEYSTIEDLIQILKSVFTGTFLILFSTFIYNRTGLIPRSIIVIDLLILVTLLGGSRLTWRIWRERIQKFSKNTKSRQTKALIFGTGDLGAHLLKYLRQFYPNYAIVGFIDDDRNLLKANLMGKHILGTRLDIPKIAKSKNIKELLISDQNISSENLASLVDICAKAGIKHKITTSVIDLPTKEIHISKIKNIEISDLLERDSISLDLSSIHKMVSDKTVLVTGAGGSIGSQLCSHILEYEPKCLVMIDIGENYLYNLKMDLDETSKSTTTEYIFSSITDSQKMGFIFSKFKPQLVFHAAAHKHVPILEENIDQAINNNVLGTKLIADLSSSYGVEKFVLVSTDKVVNPSSVMGKTKNLAEKYIQYVSLKNQTRFMTVRFGNVLGSNGSVVPLFENQVAKGGPITITHPDMTRYFMLIPEAVQLILQAGAIGKGGEIFLLKMGTPVKILDLAKKIIKLAGYTPLTEIKIVYTGIRPGEKLTEELIDADENLVPTKHEKINLIRAQNTPTPDFGMKLENFLLKTKDLTANEKKTLLHQMVFNSPDINW